MSGGSLDSSAAGIRVRCSWFEVGLLLVATFLFFRPDWVVDRFYPRYVGAPASEIVAQADKLAADDWLVVAIAGTSVEGEAVTKTVALPMGDGANGRERLRNGGVTIVQLGSEVEIANVKFGSRARKLGVEQGFKIQELRLPNPARPSPHWVLLPAAALAWLVWWLQGRRRVRPVAATPA